MWDQNAKTAWKATDYTIGPGVSWENTESNNLAVNSTGRAFWNLTTSREGTREKANMSFFEEVRYFSTNQWAYRIDVSPISQKPLKQFQSFENNICYSNIPVGNQVWGRTFDNMEPNTNPSLETYKYIDFGKRENLLLVRHGMNVRRPIKENKECNETDGRMG